MIGQQIDGIDGIDGIISMYPNEKLTVSDIERLAKAGVTMTFADVAAQITRDPPATPKTEYLADAIWKRWDVRSRDYAYLDVYSTDNGNPVRVDPFELYAVCGPNSTKVHVFVTPSKTRRPVVIEDERTLFPSDALLTSLVLLLETQETQEA